MRAMLWSKTSIRCNNESTRLSTSSIRSSVAWYFLDDDDDHVSAEKDGIKDWRDEDTSKWLEPLKNKKMDRQSEKQREKTIIMFHQTREQSKERVDNDSNSQ